MSESVFDSIMHGVQVFTDTEETGGVKGYLQRNAYKRSVKRKESVADHFCRDMTATQKVLSAAANTAEVQAKEEIKIYRLMEERKQVLSGQDKALEAQKAKPVAPPSPPPPLRVYASQEVMEKEAINLAIGYPAAAREMDRDIFVASAMRRLREKYDDSAVNEIVSLMWKKRKEAGA